jgi:uncharacterized glyoxalase superfamily protein PhnB
MITGVELDFVVKDVLKALELYEKIFEVERIEVTSFPVGSNEAVFSIYGARLHMLDENEEYQMVAPKEGDPKPFWFNVSVPDIKKTFESALANGCTQIQEIIDMPDFGAMNAMFVDPFGYIWMLHQINEVVSFEDRVKHLEASEK